MASTQKNTCKDCLAEGTTCTLCKVDTNLLQIETSISAVQDTDVAHSLMMAVDKVSMQEIKQKEAAAFEVIQDIKILADKYRVLETKTRRTVRDVKDYGEKLKEAAEEYVEDGDISEFLQEIGDVKNLKISIEKANEQHGVIKGQVKDIQERVDKHELSFNQQAEHNKQEDKNQMIPGRYAIKGFQKDKKRVDEIVEKWDVSDTRKTVTQGAYAATAGLLTGVAVVCDTVIYSVGFPIWVIRAMMANTDAKNYAMMENQFKVISRQMQSVDIHLGTIVKNIGEIESNLNKAKQAEEKFIMQNKAEASTEKADREKRVKKLVDRANTLIASCEDYFLQLESGALKIAEIE